MGQVRQLGRAGRGAGQWAWRRMSSNCPFRAAEEDLVLYSTTNRVTTITLNNPAKYNAWNKVKYLILAVLIATSCCRRCATG